MGDRDDDRSTRVYVGGLNDSVKKEDLEIEFEKFGKLNSVWVAFNPPGFAFIEFCSHDDAETACDNLNGTDLMGSKLRVELARGRGRRGGGGGFRGGRGGSRGRSSGGSSGGSFRSYGDSRGYRGGRGSSRGGRPHYDDYGSSRGGGGSYSRDFGRDGRRGSSGSDSYRGPRRGGPGRFRSRSPPGGPRY